MLRFKDNADKNQRITVNLNHIMNNLYFLFVLQLKKGISEVFINILLVFLIYKNALSCYAINFRQKTILLKISLENLKLYLTLPLFLVLTFFIRFFVKDKSIKHATTITQTENKKWLFFIFLVSSEEGENND